jgi:aspartyl-tRNA(Asn)/glutamyl-tRNA(Gln) amidotransferase subunit C
MGKWEADVPSAGLAISWIGPRGLFERGGGVMKIGVKDVEYVARLARLTLTDEERDEFAVQLNEILTYMDTLNELDTKEVKPTSHVIPVRNVFRPDEVRESLPREPSLGNAPEAEKGFYKVPRIIE